jgi:hypothetical protein
MKKLILKTKIVLVFLSLFIEELELNQTKRKKSNKKGKIDNSEKIMVFQK